MGKQKGRSLKKNRAAAAEEATEIVNAPHSFVLHRGLPCPYIVDLTKDYRRMMEPFTAAALRERKSNKLKDFVSLSGVFHVSHICIFNKAQSQLSFKVARLPRGPTLTFKVHQFTLARDIISSTRKQFVDEDSFKHAPLIILNNFTGEGRHFKLMANTFQNMFPTINLATVQLSTIQRCVLISYNPTTDLIDIRHFAVTVAPVGLSRNVKKVVMGKIPNLSRCEDIADFLAAGNHTDSEFEDDETGQVVLPQTLKSRGNLENNKSAVKLHEIGPRLTFELTKIEDGLFKGDVLFHRRVIKTEEELAAIAAERAEKKRTKALRRKQQEENAARKEGDKEEQKQRSLKGGQERHDRNEVDTPPDDDAAYYKEEVGLEPDEELFSAAPQMGRKRGYTPKYMAGRDAKRRKTDGDERDDRRVGSGRGGGRGGRGGGGGRDRDDRDDRKFGGGGRGRGGGGSRGRGGGRDREDRDDRKFGGGGRGRGGGGSGRGRGGGGSRGRGGGGGRGGDRDDRKSRGGSGFKRRGRK